jgi:hypothetical protein
VKVENRNFASERSVSFLVVTQKCKNVIVLPIYNSLNESRGYVPLDDSPFIEIVVIVPMFAQ